MSQRHLSDVIRRTPITLPATATVQQACKTMMQHRIGAVLVVDKHDQLEGIFTGRDAVKLLAQPGDHAHAPLHSVMTRNPDHMPPTHNAIDALRLMHDGGFRHVPIVEHGKVVGITSIGDFRSHEHARHDEETGFWERL